MTVIRPSARVRLTIRTEEFEETAELESRLPRPWTEIPQPPAAAPGSPPSTTPASSDTTAARLTANQERRRALGLRRSSMSSEEFDLEQRAIDDDREDIYRGIAARTETTHLPESVAGSARDDLTVLGEILPISAQIELNGLSTADTASVTLNYIDVPIDPRIIRACHIELIIGVVRAENFEAGIERGEVREDGSLVSIVGEADGILEGATTFVGFVDDWAVGWGDNGDTVTLECRDMSAPLRDIKLPAGASIDMTLPLDEGVTALLNDVSATTRGVNVTYQGDGDAPIPVDAQPARRRPRRGRRGRRARRAGGEMSLWDHINDVVRASGFVPFVRGFDLFIMEPRTLFTSIGAARMVYGRNLEKLDFSRRLQGTKVPTIEVRAYDSEIGRTRWARYPIRDGEPGSGVLGVNNPPRPRRANEVTPSGANPDESVQTIVVSGVIRTEVLEQIARNAFEQIGRQEIEGNFETGDANSYDLPPENADLLKLQFGDPVEVLIARATDTDGEELGSSTTLARLQAMDRQRRTTYMTALGWDETVAARFASLQDATGFQTVFRTQDVRISWDSDSGLRISVSFINYITVREDA